MKLLRKTKHKKYVRCYVADLRWDIVNVSILASRVGWTKEIQQVINNNACLIRKYERRMRWIIF